MQFHVGGRGAGTDSLMFNFLFFRHNTVLYFRGNS
jgi:hypothetical protein